MEKKILFGVAAIYLLWGAVVMISGLGGNLLGASWDFATVGQLGDSFGVLNAGMAAAAAAFTLQTLLNTRRENRKLRKREAKLNEATRRRDVELTFFRMLEFRRDILADVKAAAEAQRETVHSFVNNFTKDCLTKGPTKSYSDNIPADELAHYFRTNFHIVKFLDDNLGRKRAYPYIRLLRAQLSRDEQMLIGLNAIFGAGRRKMLPLINKYALLHNLSPDDKSYLKAFDLGLEAGAFTSPSGYDEG